MDKKRIACGIINHAETIITVITLIVTGLFWIFTISNLPKRVEKVEKRVDLVESEVKNLNKQILATDVKVNLILDDTNAIKTYLIQK